MTLLSTPSSWMQNNDIKISGILCGRIQTWIWGQIRASRSLLLALYYVNRQNKQLCCVAVVALEKQSLMIMQMPAA